MPETEPTDLLKAWADLSAPADDSYDDTIQESHQWPPVPKTKVPDDIQESHQWPPYDPKAEAAAETAATALGEGEPGLPGDDTADARDTDEPGEGS